MDQQVGRLTVRAAVAACPWALCFALATAACTPSAGGGRGGKSGEGSSGSGDPMSMSPSGGSGMSSGSGNGSSGNGSAGQAEAPPEVSAAVAPLRRLSSLQYRNTVQDLLGLDDATVAALALPGDDAIADRFFSNIASPVKGVDLDRYADAAESLAQKATADLGALVPCAAGGSGDAACAEDFIRSFGQRAYRRPLSDEERARLKVVFDAGGDFKTGIELVVTALLQSPKFLYLPEPLPADSGGKVVSVDGYALASRLSYFLQNTLPDEALLRAAEAGDLADADKLAAQAERLVGTERFRQTVASFHEQWLLLHEIKGADKNPELFPEAIWNPTVKAALAEEARRFVEHVLTEGDGKVETLLSAPFTFLSEPLYAHYGLEKPAGAAAGTWQKVDLDPQQRAGILTQAGLLAAQAHADRTSYILRGKLIREAIFCTPIPPPPPNAVNGEMELPATASAKERAEAHRVDPNCASCHALFDPLGFAFESYDAVGRHRTVEGNGKPVDTAVELTETRNLNGPVSGAIELVQKLAQDDEVEDCVSRQWMRFALGRDNGKDDAPSLEKAQTALRDSGNLNDLLVALVKSDAFRYQRVPQ